MSEEGIRPKMKRDGLKRETREEDETGKRDTGKQTKGKKLTGKTVHISFIIFWWGAESNGKEELSGKKME